MNNPVTGDKPATDTPILSGSHLCVELGGHRILDDVSVSFQPNLMHAIIGPNGSGKTTLVRALCRAVPVQTGRVEFNGTDLSTMSRAHIARRIAVVWQNASVPSDLTVRHLVGYGRYAHTPWWQVRDATHDNRVDEVMELAGIAKFADRRIATLSGGERQKVWLAAALAQEPTILMLDEPTTYLDVTHQLRVLDLVRQLNREQGHTVIAVMHDLTQAARYCDDCTVLRNGRVVLEGSPRVLTANTIAKNFEVEAWITEDPRGQLPVIQPRRPLKGTQ